MSAHYKQPILLIEFEEHKSFSLEVRSRPLSLRKSIPQIRDPQTVGDLKSHVKPSGKFPPKRSSAAGPEQTPNAAAAHSVQSKLVLLTLTFPRVRIIWSSSPFATADIFNDLKHDLPEPDPTRAIAIGAEDDPDAGAGVNAAAEELLRTLPGITAKNVKHVMSKVPSVRALCELDLAGVQEILGAELGRTCYNFMHRGEGSTTRKA
jgi:DNA excision repair protein ERCC-4